MYDKGNNMKFSIHYYMTEAISVSQSQISNLLTPPEIIEALSKGGVDTNKIMIVGGHGLAPIMKVARATKDVDFVVHESQLEKAVKAIKKQWPNLKYKDQAGDALRFLDPVILKRNPDADPYVIDFIREYGIYQWAFEEGNFQIVKEVYGKPIAIPTPEYAIATKLAAHISPYRKKAKSLQDKTDIAHIISANPDLDMEKLVDLGDKVYPGGGNEMKELVKDYSD